MSSSGGRAGGTPSATYRLQFNRYFGFQQACQLVSYLQELGISDAYTSPLFAASPESLHGYDVSDFSRLNAALGSPADFDQFTEQLKGSGMGLLLDIVPNHMGADLCNQWWLDVLRNGLGSAYAEWFDIDWNSPGREGKLLLPLLEDHYGEVLAAGNLQLDFDGQEFAIRYYERKFPVCSRSYVELLKELWAKCGTHGRANQLLKELELLVRRFEQFEEKGPACGEGFDELRLHFAKLIEQSAELRNELRLVLENVNGRGRTPSSFDRLHGILQQQHYRLAAWRTGPQQINYRRFFDITGLVSLRMERREVFEATHHLVLKLIRSGQITGLRIDHPDGLWSPRQYLERLQDAAGSPLYVLVEKILTGDETLPRDWAAAGTTGYDFLNRVNALFVDNERCQAFDAVYRNFTGCQLDLPEIVYACKKQVLLSSFIGELESLTRRSQRLANATRVGQDFAHDELRAALVEVIAWFPVYRTYIDEQTTKLGDADRNYIIQAVELALTKAASLDRSIVSFLQRLLLLEVLPDFGEAENQSRREFVMRFQQLTSPVMAKGLEDTAFYSFNRLISLNEVGGNPAIFGSGVQAFHDYNRSNSKDWPMSLLATATHDTKRGEDARARINVLSEIPKEWQEALARWSSLGRKQMLGAGEAPHWNDEYLIYQALLGAWVPQAETADGLQQLCERFSAYMLKAVRESKTRSSWASPDQGYEEALHGFIKQLLNPSPDNHFLNDFKPFQRRIAFFGQFNSFSQTLLKMTSPGVPDFYQGTELWDFSLVDPDNRRPVDYVLRRQLLAKLNEQFDRLGPETCGRLSELLDHNNSGEAKLFLIWRILQFRRDHGVLFQQGEYLPLSAAGPKQKHVCAFARRLGGQTVVAVAPRLVFGLLEGAERPPLGQQVWQDTVLQLPNVIAGKPYQNVLTGERHNLVEPNNGLLLGEVLKEFPVALLASS